MLSRDAKDYRNRGAAYSWKTFKLTVLSVCSQDLSTKICFYIWIKFYYLIPLVVSPNHTWLTSTGTCLVSFPANPKQSSLFFFLRSVGAGLHGLIPPCPTQNCWPIHLLKQHKLIPPVKATNLKPKHWFTAFQSLQLFWMRLRGEKVI